jgi:ATPase subunit of ABC transporter with duplicated ATPase domains
MLEIRKLNIKKVSENRELVKDLTFILNPKDKFALIGLEGIGKSTLLKAILDKNQLNYVDITGDIVKRNINIGYLPQSIKDYWSNETVIDYLLKDNPDDEILPESYRLLATLEKTLTNLNFDMETYDDLKEIESYSGGEVVKLGLAKILIRDPDVLLLDEPTNDLDLDTIIFLENFILKEERPILFISHDEALLENTANGIIHLTQIHGKRIAQTYFVKMGYHDYVVSRNLAIDNQEMIAKKQRNNFKKKMERFQQVYQKVEHQQNQAVRDPSKGRLLKKKILSLKSTEARYMKEKENFIDIPEREEEINITFNNSNPIHNSKVVLNYNKDTLYINDRVLARNIKLFIKGPKKIAIIGKNGSGKTTLMKDILTFLRKNKSIKVGYMSQNYEEQLDLSKTSINNVLSKTDKDYENKVRRVMGNLGFTGEEMEYYPANLSGGQKAKLLLLKMVIEEDNVLILDEPTRNLSPLSIPIIHKMLNDFKGAIISITHDRNFIENVFDEVYVLTENGLEKL